MRGPINYPDLSSNRMLFGVCGSKGVVKLRMTTQNAVPLNEEPYYIFVTSHVSSRFVICYLKLFINAGKYY
jgi:hypothetical protein